MIFARVTLQFLKTQISNFISVHLQLVLVVFHESVHRNHRIFHVYCTSLPVFDRETVVVGFASAWLSGALSHGRDYRRSAGGFIHGFRCTALKPPSVFLVRALREVYLFGGPKQNLKYYRILFFLHD